MIMNEKNIVNLTKIYACYKSIHYEHLMIVKSLLLLLEILFLSPWYNEIYLDYYMYMHIKWNASISFLYVLM